MWYEWFFDGIGTSVLVGVVGFILGAGADRLYVKKTKTVQKAKDNSSISNIDINDSNNVNIYATNAFDEFDIRNFSNYTNTQIAEIIIAKGTNDVKRKWFVKSLLEGKPETLLDQFIGMIDNSAEIYNLLRTLSEKGFLSSKYCRAFEEKLTDVYRSKIIEYYLSNNNNSYVASVFEGMKNNKYIYEALTHVLKSDKELFDELYQGGLCFNNNVYKNKMEEVLNNIPTEV